MQYFNCKKRLANVRKNVFLGSSFDSNRLYPCIFWCRFWAKNQDFALFREKIKRVWPSCFRNLLSSAIFRENTTFLGRCVLYHWGSKTQKRRKKQQISSKNAFWTLFDCFLHWGKLPSVTSGPNELYHWGDLTGLVPKVTQTAPFLPISTGPPGQKNPAAGKWGHLFAPLGANWLNKRIWWKSAQNPLKIDVTTF